MNDAIKDLNNLRRENKELIEENKRLYVQHLIEKAEVEEYLEHKQSFLRYKRYERYPKYNEWIVQPPLFEKLLKKLAQK